MRDSILWNTFGNIFYLICQWLITILVVRILTPTDNGYFSIAINITNLFITVAGYGMRNFQISDKNKEYSYGTYFFSRIITSALALVALVAFVFMNDYSTITRIIIILYMFYKFIELFFDIYSGIYQTEWRMDLIGKSMILRGVISLISFSIALLVTKDLALSIIALTLATAAALVIYDMKNIHKLVDLHVDTDFSALLRLLKACLPLALYSMLLATIGTIPKHILQQSAGEVVIGAYSVISNPTIFIQAFTIQVFTPFLTTFTTQYFAQDFKSFWVLFAKCFGILFALTIAAVIGAYFLGDFAIKIVLGQQYVTYGYILIPLVICAALNALAWLLSALLTIARANTALLLINLAGAIFCYLISLAIIPSNHMIGTTVAYGGTLLFINIALLVALYFKMKAQGVATKH